MDQNKYDKEYLDNICLALKRSGHKHPLQIVEDLDRESYRVILDKDFDELVGHAVMDVLRNMDPFAAKYEKEY